jgi:hypothetical protein
MPLFEKTEEERSYSENNDPAAAEKAAPAVNNAQQSALDDLLGLGDITPTAGAAATLAPAPVINSSNLVDLLGDLGVNVNSAAAPAAPVAAPAASSIPSFEPWGDDNLAMKMDFQKSKNIARFVPNQNPTNYKKKTGGGRPGYQTDFGNRVTKKLRNF